MNHQNGFQHMYGQICCNDFLFLTEIDEKMRAVGQVLIVLVDSSEEDE